MVIVFILQMRKVGCSEDITIVSKGLSQNLNLESLVLKFYVYLQCERGFYIIFLVFEIIICQRNMLGIKGEYKQFFNIGQKGEI